ncbi:MAG: flagellin [Limnohabitans sp.]|jgi:flagellin|uniref:flagellin N-terminal helical domain-containing protein n=1 Tax=Limnohabitans sp. TaxID=1907725 RepID=UPI00391AA1EA
MSVINTNIKSLISQQALNKNGRALSAAMEQLSTGKRINSAADDAAGLAISNRMTAQIRGLDQAVRNANDGISMIQTAEGALSEVTNMLQRIRELSVQAANDTYSDADRESLQLEVTELIDEIDRIGNNTMWNGMYVFAGDIGDGGDFSIQVGVGDSVDSVIEGTLYEMDAGVLDVDALDISTSADAQSAMLSIDSAISTIDNWRAEYGAKINRLTYASDNITNVLLNTTESRSRILDTDYAKASSELSRTQIIQQAATAVLAQANTDQQTVLKLLQG